MAGLLVRMIEPYIAVLRSAARGPSAERNRSLLQLFPLLRRGLTCVAPKALGLSSGTAVSWLPDDFGGAARPSFVPQRLKPES